MRNFIVFHLFIDFLFKGRTKDYIVINKQGLYWKFVMIQVNEIPIGSDPATLFANLFPAHKEADWIKARRNLGTINV